jgi:integrase
MLGLGYWCGWTQSEISTLLRDDVIEKDGETFIDRLRNKTEVKGYWWVPPEIAPLLRKEMKSTPPNSWGLAILGNQGNPLVHRAKGGSKKRTNAISLCWGRLMREAKAHGVRPLSFKYLRKSISQRVRDKLGREYAQLFCAQVVTTVADDHYNRASFDKLTAAVREIYAESTQMFAKYDQRGAQEQSLSTEKAA